MASSFPDPNSPENPYRSPAYNSPDPASQFPGANPNLEMNPDARTMGMACHLAAFAGIVMPCFGDIIGPLIIWQMKKDEHRFVDDQGKESLNFQLSCWIYLFFAIISAFFVIGFFLIPAIGMAKMVFQIIANVKARDGVAYRYPLTIRFLN